MECSPSPAVPAITYAGFRVRTAASLIDSVLMLIVTASLPLLIAVGPDETAVLVVTPVVSALVVIRLLRRTLPNRVAATERATGAGNAGAGPSDLRPLRP